MDPTFPRVVWATENPDIQIIKAKVPDRALEMVTFIITRLRCLRGSARARIIAHTHQVFELENQTRFDGHIFRVYLFFTQHENLI